MTRVEFLLLLRWRAIINKSKNIRRAFDDSEAHRRVAKRREQSECGANALMMRNRRAQDNETVHLLRVDDLVMKDAAANMTIYGLERFINGRTDVMIRQWFHLPVFNR